MTGFVIQLANTDGLPVYNSPKTGQKLGVAQNGWVESKEDALRFARAKDAQEYVDVLLVNCKADCNVVPV